MMDACETQLAVDDAVRQALEYRATHAREFAPHWYPWQREFFSAGKVHRERLCLAGNRTGKTLSVTYELALHLTGDYPSDWSGYRAHRQGTYWALGVDNRQLRDVLQRALIGEITDDGRPTGGWIHTDEVMSISRSQTPGLASDIIVRHVSGRRSMLSLRAYTQTATGQGTLPFAGSSVDGVLVDEQPPDGIMGQLVTRTMTGMDSRGGLLIYSMTPELGETDLIRRFTSSSRAPHQHLTGPVAWSQCAHLTPQIQAEILASIPVHERDMRSLGVPMLGQGRVFDVAEDRITCEPFESSTRPWMRVVRAIDIGIDHPTAIAWIAYDPEVDTAYVMRVYRRSGEVPSVHMAVANSMWPHAPLIVPPDIDQREKGSGRTVRAYYQDAGAQNLVTFANPDGSVYVEPGILAMSEGLRNEKIKVFANCNEFFDEYRGYHRRNGKIVAERDDVISAVRYGLQTVKKYGVTVQDVQRHHGRLYPDLGLRDAPQSARRGYA